MTRSRIVFDQELDSTPHDRAGVLVQWTTYGRCPLPVAGKRWPARQWGATHIESGGWNAADPGHVFHGTRGLTARFLATPDYAAALDQPMALLYRGQAGPARAQLWAYGFYVIVRAATIELVHTYHNAAGQHVWNLLGHIGRPPPGTALFLAFVLDGTQATAYVDGQHVGSRAMAPVLYTTDVPMALGHRYSATLGSQLRWRGVVEYVEIEDTAGTPDSERHRHDALVDGAALAAETVRALAPIAGPSYDRYRVRPLADRVADIEAACTRLEQSATPPRAYGSILGQWEQALDITPWPTDDVATRQRNTWQAAQAPLGHRPADIAAYAASLFGVPAEEVTILEPSSWYPVPTEGAGVAPAGAWIARGDVLMTATGLRLRHAASQLLGDLDPVHAYVGFDHDELAGRSQNAFACRLVTATNSKPDHQVGLFLAHASRTPSHWLLVRDDAGWSAQLATYAAPWTYTEQLIKPLSSPACAITLSWDRGVLRVRVSETGNFAERSITVPRVDRIGFGVLGQSVVPTSDITATWTGVEILAADSGVSYQAYAYHPSPAIRRPLEHTALLGAHSRATCRITATQSAELRCDDSASGLDLTPIQRPRDNP